MPRRRRLSKASTLALVSSFPRPLAARSRVSMSVTVERQKEPLVSVS